MPGSPQFPSIHTALRQLTSQGGDLIQQSLALPSSIRSDFVPQVVDLKSGSGRRVALGSLDPADLHLQEKLWNFDAQASTDTSNTCLSRKVHVQAILERLKIGRGKRGLRGELGQGEGQGRLTALAEVDVAEGHSAAGDVGHIADGLLGGGARHGRLDGVDGVLYLGRKRRGSDHEARGRRGLARVEAARGGDDVVGCIGDGDDGGAGHERDGGRRGCEGGGQGRCEEGCGAHFGAMCM